MPPPILTEEIISHSTNVHVIPASAEIAYRCKLLRTGTLVSLSGSLVEAVATDWEGGGTYSAVLTPEMVPAN
jgi:hypothetical protein